ncbi:(Na+)-NQR maturation NqrM [Amphritea sp. 1_MG-2023]|uniref:(Na+)-NQR maturation NqrM n=1 Tax=Amphritea sp. 1_MG-2023 TaxID=3062670 RepID=UPI0026E38F82|nr:(Na+)-NQR maturation NqrM [Amphritea sp. 1_MG-2023]MDO6562494.1 (Na+)-NQR maturation NqrM [Amphritea sp. 1_MG-2023]
MSTMILTFIVLLMVVAGMSVGVLMGRKPIAGSCGGLAAVGIDQECSICGGNPSKCEEEQDKQSRKEELLALAYDAKSER